MARRSLRQSVLAGDTVLGAMIFETFAPYVPQVLANAGCRYVIYDMEHTGASLESIKAQVAYARGLPIAPLARVPRGEYHFLARALDIGCHGVMVPMVESLEQARAIVEACRYPPKGRRGAAFGFAHDDYSGGDPKAKIKAADARNLVIAQIETERGLENCEAIAAVDGIDVLWVGHFDLTNFLGIPGEFDHPRYLEAVKRIVAAGRQHRKGLGFMAADPRWAKDYQQLGFNMLAAGTDQGILAAGVAAILAGVRES